MNTTSDTTSGGAQDPNKLDIKHMSAEEVLALMDKDLEALKALSKGMSHAPEAAGDDAEELTEDQIVASLAKDEGKADEMNAELDLRLNEALDEFVEAEEKEEIKDQSAGVN